jgi:hypothetical protein
MKQSTPPPPRHSLSKTAAVFAAVLFIFTLIACSNPAGSGGKSAAEEAADFRTAHSAILAKTASTVAITDEGAVDAALAAYNGLSAEVKALLTAEKARLDALKAAITDLKAASGQDAVFRTTYGEILNKTADIVTPADESAVDAALAAYEDLSEAAQALLTAQKDLLDDLKTKIEALKAAAAAFRTDHAGILVKTVSTVAIADESAVDDALAAYNGLSTAEKTLLTAEKTLLDALKARIDTLGQGSITLVYPRDAASGELSGGSIVIYQGQANGTEQHTLTVAGTFDSYQWLVDGSFRGNGDTLILNAADYSPGVHQLSLEVTLNGGVYSKDGSFKVE